MGHAAAEHVRATFGPAAHAEAMVDVYRNLRRRSGYLGSAAVFFAHAALSRAARRAALLAWALSRPTAACAARRRGRGARRARTSAFSAFAVALALATWLSRLLCSSSRAGRDGTLVTSGVPAHGSRDDDRRRRARGWHCISAGGSVIGSVGVRHERRHLARGIGAHSATTAPS